MTGCARDIPETTSYESTSYAVYKTTAQNTFFVLRLESKVAKLNFSRSIDPNQSIARRTDVRVQQTYPHPFAGDDVSLKEAKDDAEKNPLSPGPKKR